MTIQEAYAEVEQELAYKELLGGTITADDMIALVDSIFGSSPKPACNKCKYYRPARNGYNWCKINDINFSNIETDTFSCSDFKEHPNDTRTSQD